MYTGLPMLLTSNHVQYYDLNSKPLQGITNCRPPIHTYTTYDLTRNVVIQRICYQSVNTIRKNATKIILSSCHSEVIVPVTLLGPFIGTQYYNYINRHAHITRSRRHVNGHKTVKLLQKNVVKTRYCQTESIFIHLDT